METAEIEAERAMSREEAHALIRVGAPAGEWEPNVRAPAVVTLHGEPVAAVTRYGGDMAQVRAAFREYPMTTVKRAIGIRTRSAVFGYVDRKVHMKREGCRECSGAHDAPHAHNEILRAGGQIADDLAATIPERADRDQSLAGTAIRPDWRIPGTPWTSGVLNDTSPLPYHYDRNNLPTWSAMIVARRHTDGGHLHIPELGLVLACRDGDVVHFPGWHYVHGVTPIHKRRPDAYRYSCVFYTVAGMAGCHDPADELARARASRSKREDELLDRQAAEGLLGGNPCT